MIVCVTGLSGFVGQNLTRYLRDTGSDIELRSITRQSHMPLLPPDFSDCHAVIHLAGKAHDLRQVSDPNEYYDANFRYTKKVFDAFCASNSKKFIFISSIKSVADADAGILTEEIDPDPHTHYGKSKLLAEKYIESVPLPAGKSYYIFRPCMIHGPGNKGNLNLLFKFVAKGIPYPLSAFNNKRSFLSVDNLCFVLKEVIDRSDIAPGTYNIADDEPLSTKEVVRLLSVVRSKPLKLLAIPKGLVSFFARVGDVLKLPLNSERLSKLTGDFVVSNNKLKEAIGKDFPLTARQGIQKTGRSFIEVAAR